ncbi:MULTISPECIES: helix-hairpin-helix domain-containing protein [Halomonas]|uniref:helix-hairpin-helix domain-containing protein n=1 Tax=Halomonas TaxID=2745 RepID=UPI001C93E622|nr:MULTISPECIES: helix-hairpin-helix domain-containing protein [Halomonas]MBY6207402.1 helix-hairpin-helix domain-containing protein [Halomonas sp. DP3Y7-2]MBY6228211.1 helix-hairpin-helix domain-containing protein [Halomonas sp. DP3Y7-1]MCA0916277.1 helix-hairpin-helix domain-containing protein [Halomonas denitrificans]
MAFTDQERAALLELRGVGPSVVQRFEEIGIDSFEALAEYEMQDIVEQVASMLGSTCWKNSPQARTAVASAVELARRSLASQAAG